MCLLTDMKEAMVADGPVYCYKLLDCGLYGDGTRRFMSPLKNHDYLPDTVMLAEGPFMNKRPEHIPEGGWFTVSHGFHSYASLDAMTFNPYACMCNGIVLAKCRIPRGARYWKGVRAGMGRAHGYDEYCSDRIELVAWSQPDSIEWRRPKTNPNLARWISRTHPGKYKAYPVGAVSILNGLTAEEAFSRLRGYCVRESYVLGDTEIHVLSSAYGTVELRVSQGTVCGQTPV